MSGWPFENRLDTRWFVDSPVHEEALARLLFLIEERRRFGALTGAAGTGKSLLLKVVTEQARRANRHIVQVDCAGLDAYELVWQLAAALRIAPQADDSLPRLWTRVNDHLAGQDSTEGHTVMLFDHANSASTACLKQLERLIHRDGRGPAPETVIVAGEADDFTQRWPMVQSLVDLWIALTPLQRDQHREYITRLVEQAGCKTSVFEPETLDLIFEQTAGVPRAVNRLCELSMLAAMGQGAHTVPAGVVRAVVWELRSISTTAENPPARQFVS